MMNPLAHASLPRQTKPSKKKKLSQRKTKASIRVIVDGSYLGKRYMHSGFYRYLLSLLLALRERPKPLLPVLAPLSKSPSFIKKTNRNRDIEYLVIVETQEDIPAEFLTEIRLRKKTNIHWECLDTWSKSTSMQSIKKPAKWKGGFFMKTKTFQDRLGLLLEEKLLLDRPPNTFQILFLAHLQVPSQLKRLHRKGLKVLITVHDLLPTRFLRLKNMRKRPLKLLTLKGFVDYFQMRYLAAFVDGFLSVSETSKKDIVSVIGREDIVHVTPLGHLGAKNIVFEIKPKIKPEIKPESKPKAVISSRLGKACGYQKKLQNILDKARSVGLMGVGQQAQKKACMLSISHADAYVLYFCGHTVRKNLGPYVEAYLKALWSFLETKAQAQKKSGLALVQQQSIPLLITGRGYWQQYLFKKLSSSRSSDFARKTVLFLPNLAWEELALLIQKSLFTVHPSLAEGFGLPAFESMALGTLALMARNSATNEHFSSLFAETSMPCFNPYSPASMQAASLAMFQLGRAEKQSLLKKARKIMAGHSWENTAEATKKIVLEICS